MTLQLDPSQLSLLNKNKPVKVSIIPTPTNFNELRLSPSELKQIQTYGSKLVSELPSQSGGSVLGAVTKIALPFIKKTLPKILGTLGLAAATGAISGATHKATSGKGLNKPRLMLTNPQLKTIHQLGQACVDCSILPETFSTRMNKNLKQQRGGFIGTLLASLAASLLPSLLSGKSLYRAGTTPKPKGKSLYRAGTKPTPKPKGKSLYRAGTKPELEGKGILESKND